MWVKATISCKNCMKERSVDFDVRRGIVQKLDGFEVEDSFRFSETGSFVLCTECKAKVGEAVDKIKAYTDNYWNNELKKAFPNVFIKENKV